MSILDNLELASSYYKNGSEYLKRNTAKAESSVQVGGGIGGTFEGGEFNMGDPNVSVGVNISDHKYSVDLSKLSGIPGDAQLKILGYDANGGIMVALGEDGLMLTLEGEAAAYLVNLGYENTVGPIDVNFGSLVGAQASASAGFDIDILEGDFELEVGFMVGASVSAGGEIELRHISVGGEATGIAGFAAEVELEVGFDDWEFEFDASGKLAFLLGAGASVNFSVDGKQIVADLGTAGKVIWDQSGKIVEGTISNGKKVVDFGTNIVNNLLPGGNQDSFVSNETTTTTINDDGSKTITHTQSNRDGDNVVINSREVDGVTSITGGEIVIPYSSDSAFLNVLNVAGDEGKVKIEVTDDLLREVEDRYKTVIDKNPLFALSATGVYDGLFKPDNIDLGNVDDHLADPEKYQHLTSNLGNLIQDIGRQEELHNIDNKAFNINHEFVGSGSDPIPSPPNPDPIPSPPNPDPIPSPPSPDPIPSPPNPDPIPSPPSPDPIPSPPSPDPIPSPPSPDPIPSPPSPDPIPSPPSPDPIPSPPSPDPIPSPPSPDPIPSPPSPDPIPSPPSPDPIPSPPSPDPIPSPPSPEPELPPIDVIAPGGPIGGGF